eukprot:COSAG01_NODE_2250_length_8075_cov_16.059303_3_plen_239_part_00
MFFARMLALMLSGLLTTAARPLSEDEKVLHKAINAGDLATVEKQLQAKGLDPDAPNPEDGATPMMIATGKGDFKIVKALLNGGAYARAVDNAGRTALMVACHSGQPHIVSLFLKSARKVSHLVNEQSNEGWTALMIASLRGFDLMVKQLLDHGAEVNLQRNDGWTALMFSASETCADGRRPGNCKKVNTLLMDAGADVSLGAKGGPTGKDLMLKRAEEEKERAKQRKAAGAGMERTDL